MRRALAIATMTCLSACSFALARVPSVPDDWRGRTSPPLDCPIVSPVFDTVVAALLVPGGTALLVDGAHSGQPQESAFGVTVGVPGLVFLASAIYGWNQRSRCKRLDASIHAAT